MNRRTTKLALAVCCAALSGCGLFAPSDGTVLVHTYDSTAYTIYWANPDRDVRLECLVKNTWVIFQTTRIGTTILALGTPGLYGAGLNAVIPDQCWTVAAAGAAAPFTATIHALVQDTPGMWLQSPTYTQAASQCLFNNSLHSDNPSSPDWVNRSLHCYTGLTAHIYAKQTHPQVSAMFNDPAAADPYEPAVHASGLSRTSLPFYADDTNLLTIDGLDLGEHPSSPYWGRVPWDAFLVDAPNPAQALSFYRDLLARNGVSNGPLDTRACAVVLTDSTPTPHGWLCAADQHAATIQATRMANGTSRRLHLYAFIVDGFGSVGTPKQDIDGILPSAFGSPASLNNAPGAAANLMQFLTLLYQADYVEPWREFNSVDVNSTVPLQSAYEYIVARVHSAAPTAVVTASVALPFANCYLNPNACGAIPPKTIQTLQTYWRINRSNPHGVGAVPFVIALSNYVEPVVTAPDLGYAHLTNRAEVSPNNVYRVLQATADLFTDPAEKDAFRHTPIAVAEGSWGTYIPIPLWLLAPVNDAAARLEEEKQAAYLKWLLDYRHDAQDPGIHPVLFVANWWGVDQEFFAPEGEGPNPFETASGIIGSATQRYRWKPVTSVHRAALSGFQNTDVDGDGVTDLVLDTATGTVLSQDNCPGVSNANQADADGDGIGDACDNCPATPNRSQSDWDQDGHGNRCDADFNNDGVVDAIDLLIIGTCTPGTAFNQTVCDTIRTADVNGKPYPLHAMDLDEDGNLAATDFGVAVSLLGIPLQGSPFACAGQRPCPAGP